MNPIRIDFCDFWPGFCKTDNFFYNTLKRRFPIQICDQPDYMIYAIPNRHQHRMHTGVRIFFCVESFAPDWSEYDYAMTTRYVDDPRHLRLPYYAMIDPKPLVRGGGEDWEQVLRGKTHFCSFVVSNSGSRKTSRRVDFFHKLSQYKKVDSAGAALNNMGWRLPCTTGAKEEFLRRYKFNIAFENSSIPGYVTEKIVEPFLARCLPIYWGCPRVKEEFNPASFLNSHDFPSDEALIEKIIELDRDDQKYQDWLRQPCFHNNKPNPYFDPDRILDFFEHIFTTPIRPVAQRRKFFRLGRWVLVKKNPPPPMAVQG
jgi:hypothetical protein